MLDQGVGRALPQEMQLVLALKKSIKILPQLNIKTPTSDAADAGFDKSTKRSPSDTPFFNVNGKRD